MIRRNTVCVTLVLLLASAAFAQMETPKPAPELQKADYFLGNWSMTGDMKPSPMGPGGKMTSTSKAEWMEGKHFMMIHSNFKSGMGDGTSEAFFGYDPEQKMYTYSEFNSMGQADRSLGTLSGDTWTFTDSNRMGGKTFNGRYTMKITSPTTYDFKLEMQPDGGPWMTVMEGKATKQ